MSESSHTLLRGHGSLRYCGIELFFQAVGILVILILMYGIGVSSGPAVWGFSSFLLKVFSKRRSFKVLQHHLFALSCLTQVNTTCNTKHSKLYRLIKVNIFEILDFMINKKALNSAESHLLGDKTRNEEAIRPRVVVLLS